MVRQKKTFTAASRDQTVCHMKTASNAHRTESGIVNNFGYGAECRDSDLTRRVYRIFVANDFAEGDYMYINQKNGTFKEQIKKATNHISMYSMALMLRIFNNDGLEDIMVQ